MTKKNHVKMQKMETSSLKTTIEKICLVWKAINWLYVGHNAVLKGSEEAITIIRKSQLFIDIQTGQIHSCLSIFVHCGISTWKGFVFVISSQSVLFHALLHIWSPSIHSNGPLFRVFIEICLYCLYTFLSSVFQYT